MVDAFHTFFGIAALSLMGHPELEPVDAMYALPISVVERIKTRNAKQSAAVKK